MNKKKTEGAYTPAFDQSRKRLQQLSPDMVSKSSLVRFDRTTNCFAVESFGYDIEISYPEGQITFKDSDKRPSLGWSLILLNYLSSAKELPPKNQWVSYRDLPQGNVFYPHIRTHILETLGTYFSQCDKDKLQQTLQKLGFVSVPAKADVAAVANFSPRIPVLLQFWEGEEGIPASCQMLFDRTIAEQMHIEDIAALCGVVKELIISRVGS